MKWTWYIALFLSFFPMPSYGQTDVPTFKAEAVGAVVWDENSPILPSVEVTDPVTGRSIRRLNHAGLEVSLRAGFRIVRSGEAGEILMFTVTVANNTPVEVIVTQAGVVIDEHVILPLSPVAEGIRVHSKRRYGASSLDLVRCLSSDFGSPETLVGSSIASGPLKITPRTSLTLSFSAKDPRNYSLLCSSRGCHPKGVLRFYITLNSTDYVFAWRGEALTNCGN